LLKLEVCACIAEVAKSREMRMNDKRFISNDLKII
jgi:hypothetical protein